MKKSKQLILIMIVLLLLLLPSSIFAKMSTYNDINNFIEVLDPLLISGMDPYATRLSKIEINETLEEYYNITITNINNYEYSVVDKARILAALVYEKLEYNTEQFIVGFKEVPGRRTIYYFKDENIDDLAKKFPDLGIVKRTLMRRDERLNRKKLSFNELIGAMQKDLKKDEERTAIMQSYLDELNELIIQNKELEKKLKDNKELLKLLVEYNKILNDRLECLKFIIDLATKKSPITQNELEKTCSWYEKHVELFFSKGTARHNMYKLIHPEEKIEIEIQEGMDKLSMMQLEIVKNDVCEKAKNNVK